MELQVPQKPQNLSAQAQKFAVFDEKKGFIGRPFFVFRLNCIFMMDTALDSDILMLVSYLVQCNIE